MKKLVSILLSVSILVSGLFITIASAVSKTGQALTEKSYSVDIMPFGGSNLGYEKQRIDYAYKTMESYENPYILPTYLSAGVGVCAVTAAGAAIGHYDRIYDELIPNHTGSTFLGKWRYGSHGDGVTAMHSSLYSLMGTTANGTTINGYKSGLNAYVTDKGRTLTLSSAMNGSSINIQLYKSELSSGKLMTIFLDGFGIVPFGETEVFSGYDTVGYYKYGGAHVMMAYGYFIIKYYDSNNALIRENNYLYVSTGFSGTILAFIDLNMYSYVDDAYITWIS